jgi:ATP-dependent helicase/nuclease subunit A
MAKQWKPGQLKAIEWRRGELIVSASAGTGKTSVIIERAWQIVRGGQANVDEMMIVTFTEDAAEELKTRFRDRLDAEIMAASAPEDRAFLREQLHRLDRAQISTIHSLCLRVIRENYHRLGISEAVEVFPPEQVTLLKHRTMEKVLADAYEDEGEFGKRFRELVERYGGGGVDAYIAQTVLRVHGFLGSLAWPDKWIEETRQLARVYRSDDFKIGELPAWRYLSEHWRGLLEEAEKEFFKLAGEAAGYRHEKVDAYLLQLTELTQHWRKLLEAGDDRAMLANVEITLPRSPGIRKEEEKVWWTPIKEQVDAAKDYLKQLAEEFGEAMSGDVRESLKRQAEFIDTLLELLAKFSERLESAKSETGQLEFDDLQRLALRVLSGEVGEAAEQYRELFRFVMVDEYQDINELQDTIIRLICRPDETHSERCSNLFMVGDVKQSIYRFRQAEPEIFQSLYRLAKDGKGLNRIDLADNFRSRREVLDSVNAVFTPVLGGGELELEYDEGSQLVCGAVYPQTQQPTTTELHILERKIEADEENDLAEMESLSREAWLAARTIRQLVDSKFPVSANGEVRPIVPEDVVILLRSVRNTAGKYVSMLRRVGLSAHCQQMEAFLEYPEIADVVSLLRIIDNPFHDIPLATVLRSPFVGATMDELAEIRLAAGKGHFYSGLMNFVRDNPLSPAGQKFQRFLDQYERWRRRAGCCCVAELIQEIYLKTHYPEFIRASMPELTGTENLEQFLEMAWQFSSDGGTDLRDFLDYLAVLEEGTASISSIQAGTGAGVRIMSIHASKGLEFPAVVLGNLGKKANLRDIQQDILIDRNLLMGLKDVEPMGLSKTNTLPVLAIARRGRNQSIAEELRLLYVAMTRAKEKLIMIGSGEGEKLGKMLTALQPGADGRFQPRVVAKRDKALDWIGTALSATVAGKTNLLTLLGSDAQATADCGGAEVSFYPAAEQLQWAVDRSVLTAGTREKAEDLLAKIDQPPTALSSEENARIEKVLNILDWRYPHEVLCTTPTNFSVTELTHRAAAFTALNAAEGDAMDQARPIISGGVSFPDGKNREAIERGNAWHTFMEKTDLNQSLDEENLRSQLESLVAGHALTLDEVRLIDPHKVERFFASTPGRLMLTYRESLYRELPFTFLLAGKDFPKKLASAAVEEPILIQGIIDCLAKTETGFVIIDYKTNAISAGEVDRMTEHYRTQIELYCKAMSEILGEPAVSAWLYFSEPDSAVQVM